MVSENAQRRDSVHRPGAERAAARQVLSCLYKGGRGLFHHRGGNIALNMVSEQEDSPGERFWQDEE